MPAAPNTRHLGPVGQADDGRHGFGRIEQKVFRNVQPQPARGVQRGAYLRLQGQRQVAVSGTEAIGQEAVRHKVCQLLFRAVTADLDPGAAAGVQNDGPGHIPGLLGAKEVIKLRSKRAGHQHGPAALGKHFLRDGSRQEDLCLRQQEALVCPLQRANAEGVSGLHCRRQTVGHGGHIRPNGFVFPTARAQISQGLVHDQLHKPSLLSFFTHICRWKQTFRIEM